MSKATPSGPPCLYCSALHTTPKGKSKQGKKRNRCGSCGRYHTEGEPLPVGRPRDLNPTPEALRKREERLEKSRETGNWSAEDLIV